MKRILKLENGIFLDFNKAEIREADLSAHKDLLEISLQKMADLEAGEIANESEGRMVGHYWLRHSKMAPSEAIRAHIDLEKEKIERFYQENKEKYAGLIWLGIGGSALGPVLLAEIFKRPEGKDFRFLDNTDPETFYRMAEEIGPELKDYLLVVVSKSGGTKETANMLEEVSLFYEEKGWSFARQAVCITMPESKLERRAKEEGWQEIFYIWDWVGGRTSISSALGLLILSFLQADSEAFLKGFKDADKQGREEAEKNPALLMALDLYLAKKDAAKDQLIVLPYKDKLELFPKYLQQLVMESLGKDGQGITLFGNKGASDQHSYLQQLFDGPNNFIVHFINVRKYDSFAHKLSAGNYSNDYLYAFNLATAAALFAGDRRSINISLPQVDEYYLGWLIGLYERMTSFYAFMIDVNAYDQPAVERGKKAAEEIINLKNDLLDLLLYDRQIDWSVQELLEHSQKSASVTFSEVFALLEYMVDSGLYPLERLEKSSSSPKRGAEGWARYRGIS